MYKFNILINYTGKLELTDLYVGYQNQNNIKICFNFINLVWFKKCVRLSSISSVVHEIKMAVGQRQSEA